MMRALRRWTVLLPYVLFVVGGIALFWNAMGDDLASSYVGCRVLASGGGTALYSYDPVNFAGLAEGERAWPREAAAADYTGYLHPYVQTPLWAWSLRPLCEGMDFPAFKRLFLALALLSLAGCVALTAWAWTPRLAHAGVLFAILAVLFFSEPLLYMASLVQTHPLLLLLALLGLVLAQRGRPGWAGLCVALAAAVKITPAVLLVYWLAGRRWRAAASFLAWSAGLLVLTRWIAGAPLFHAYLASLHRTSNVLLVSENNQSLPAWWMGHRFAPDEIFDVNAFALPAKVKLVSSALMVGFAALGGWMDRARMQDRLDEKRTQPSLGAGVALVAMTIFAPIAWTHYFVLLVVPFMLLAEALWPMRMRPRVWNVAALALLSIALLYRPLAPDVIRMDLGDAAVLRGVFWSGVMLLLALLCAGWLQRLHGRHLKL